MAPKLHYFPLRGRGEVIRLTLAAAGVEYDEVTITWDDMKAKSGTAACPFGQCPLYEDGDLILPQQDAITRHLGRQHNMYGSNGTEAAHIDSVLIGVEGLRTKYLELVYQNLFGEEAKGKYADLHIGKGGLCVRNGGGHFGYINGYLERNAGGMGYVVGSALSIADIAVFDIVDLHLREAAFPNELAAAYPLLKAHHDRIAALPGVAAHLASEKRLAKVNGNNLG